MDGAILSAMQLAARPADHLAAKRACRRCRTRLACHQRGCAEGLPPQVQGLFHGIAEREQLLLLERRAEQLDADRQAVLGEAGRRAERRQS